MRHGFFILADRGKTLDDLPVKRVYSFRDLKDVLVSDWKFTASMLDSDACLGIFGVFVLVDRKMCH